MDPVLEPAITNVPHASETTLQIIVDVAQKYVSWKRNNPSLFTISVVAVVIFSAMCIENTIALQSPLPAVFSGCIVTVIGLKSLENIADRYPNPNRIN